MATWDCGHFPLQRSWSTEWGAGAQDGASREGKARSNLSSDPISPLSTPRALLPIVVTSWNCLTTMTVPIALGLPTRQRYKPWWTFWQGLGCSPGKGWEPGPWSLRMLKMSPSPPGALGSSLVWIWSKMRPQGRQQPKRLITWCPGDFFSLDRLGLQSRALTRGASPSCLSSRALWASDTERGPPICAAPQLGPTHRVPSALCPLPGNRGFRWAQATPCPGGYFCPAWHTAEALTPRLPKGSSSP